MRWGLRIETVDLEVVEASRLDDIREQREDVADLACEVMRELVATQVLLAEDILTGLIDRFSQFLVLVFPIFSIPYAIDRLPDFGVVERKDANTSKELRLILSAVAPDLEQLEHTEWRFQIFVAQDDENAVALADRPHELRNAVANA
jgi:hypothetical protein